MPISLSLLGFSDICCSRGTVVLLVVVSSLLDRRRLLTSLVPATLFVRQASLCIGDQLSYIVAAFYLYNTQALPMVIYTCYVIVLVCRGSYNELTRYLGLNFCLVSFIWKLSMFVKLMNTFIVQ